MLLGARKLMSGRQQLLFVTSAGQGLSASSDQIALGVPLALGFSLLPPTHSVSRPALPARYSVVPGRSCTRRNGRTAAVLQQEAIGFSPAFALSKNCSNGFVAPCNRQSANSTASTLHGRAAFASLATVDASEPADTPAVAPGPSTELVRKQLEQQYALKQEQPSPWLGAELDIAGFTKKGYIRGGGKEQNQDRGLIMQQFRSSKEMLVGVMDGHGTNGHLVSTYLIQHLPAVLMQKLISAAAVITQSGTRPPQPQAQQQLPKKQHKHNKAQQQQPQQQPKQLQQLQPEMFASQLHYVVIPDHHKEPPSNSSSSSYNTAAAAGRWAALADANKQQSSKAVQHGRAVSRNKIVRQPELCADSSSSDSSSIPDVVTVPQSVINSVPLSQSLLSAVFVETDRMLIGSGINTLDSGSTALLCHVSDSSITTAWVGDSRAVLGRKVIATGGSSLRLQPGSSSSDSSSSSSDSWQVIQLSDDHKPERPDEQLRIILNEGRVQQMRDGSGRGVGPFRVWFKQLEYPGLAMSRAFGDTPCRRIGVTVEPELYVHRLTEADQLLVAATDGVWEYMTNEEVVQVAASCSTAEMAAKRVVECAEERWRAVDGGGYVDDITAVVVKARPRMPSSKL